MLVARDSRTEDPMRSAISLILIGLLACPTVAAAVTLGETCDGIAAIQCDPGLWCEHPSGQCQVADASGECAKVPEVCTQDYQPVCGCDGETYGNQCMLRAVKMQLDHIGACTE
jgi:hypothetical protein